MGIKFDIEITLESIDIEKLLLSMQSFKPEKIISIDNWNYENEKDISDTQINRLSSLPDSGKILQIYTSSEHDGAFIYRNNGRYICDLFFECADKNLDSSCVTEDNKDFYFKAMDFVEECFSKFGICHAAFGCEFSISDNADISEKIDSSHNVNMWAVNKNIPVKMSEKFTRFSNDNFTIFLKK